MSGLTPKEAEGLMNAYKAVYDKKDESTEETTSSTESSENNK
tara:strand:+ start:141 stop:266 length:126 start_codon:yes stop_codon:yes gene_type:complete